MVLSYLLSRMRKQVLIRLKKSIMSEAQTSASQHLTSRHMNTHYMNVLLLFLLINYY
jgi:hypothetical protein